MEQQNQNAAAGGNKKPQTPNVAILCIAGHTYQDREGKTQLRYAITDAAGNALWFGRLNPEFRKEFDEKVKAQAALNPANNAAERSEQGKWKSEDTQAVAEFEAGRKAIYLAAGKATEEAGVRNSAVRIYLVASFQEEAERTERSLVSLAINNKQGGRIGLSVVQVAKGDNPAVSFAERNDFLDYKQTKVPLASIVEKREAANETLNGIYAANRAFRESMEISQEQQADATLSQGAEPSVQEEEEEHSQGVALG
jgi:hypothetical protein